MSWVVPAGFVGAGWLLMLGLVAGRDRRLLARVAWPAAGSPSPIARLGRRVGRGRLRTAMVRRLEAAETPPEEADRMLGLKAFGALAGALVGLSTWGRGPALASASAVLLAGAGFVLPDLRLARRIRAVREQASASVADLLDLIAVSVTAGLTPRLALERAPDLVHGPLGRELARTRNETSMGAPWRVALRGTATRTGLSEIRRLAVTLERSQRLGVPVAGRLRELAREVRAERAARREERARRAPVAMLFPLVFLILPAFVLAALVPALLVATRGLP
ncbi:MAG: type II secretion system F family protein [Actinomycetota bacterium]